MLVDIQNLRLDADVRKFFYDNPEIKTVAASIFAGRLFQLEQEHKDNPDRVSTIVQEMEASYSDMVRLASASWNLAEHLTSPKTRMNLVEDYLQRDEVDS